MARENRTTRSSRSMQIGALILALLFILPYLVVAFIYPVEGMAMYLRFIGIGLFLALVFYSIRRERRGEKARPDSQEERIAKRLAHENRAQFREERHREPQHSPRPKPQ